jgi:hypothetical protein
MRSVIWLLIVSVFVIWGTHPWYGVADGSAIAISPSGEAKEIPDSERPAAVREFKTSLENNYGFLCRDKEEWQAVIEFVKERRKREWEKSK